MTQYHQLSNKAPQTKLRHCCDRCCGKNKETGGMEGMPTVTKAGYTPQAIF